MKKKLSLLLVTILIISMCSGCGYLATLDYSAGMNDQTAVGYEEMYLTAEEYSYMQSGQTSSSSDMNYIGQKEYNGTNYYVYAGNSESGEITSASCTESFWSYDVSSWSVATFGILTVKFPKAVVSTNGVIQEDGKTVVFNVNNIIPNRVYATFDTTAAATMDGPEDGSIAKKDLTISVSGSAINVTIDGKASENNTIKLSEEGIHTITITDISGTVTTKTITLDKSKPTVTGVANKKTYKKAVTIKAKDLISGLSKCTLNGKKISLSSLKKGYKVKKNGSYTLKVTDKAGNTASIKFKIKK